jgi:hypothetical protein
MASKDYIKGGFADFDAQFKLIVDTVAANTGGAQPVKYNNMKTCILVSHLLHCRVYCFPPFGRYIGTIFRA